MGLPFNDTPGWNRCMVDGAVERDSIYKIMECFLLNLVENYIIDSHTVEHIARDPADDDRCYLDESRLIIGGDFLQVAIGLAPNFVYRDFAAFGVVIHVLLQAVTGQNTFF